MRKQDKTPSHYDLARIRKTEAGLRGFFTPLDMTPNLYAFEVQGLKIVQVCGGLARLQGFNYEGMFMAV